MWFHGFHSRPLKLSVRPKSGRSAHPRGLAGCVRRRAASRPTTRACGSQVSTSSCAFGTAACASSRRGVFRHVQAPRHVQLVERRDVKVLGHRNAATACCFLYFLIIEEPSTFHYYFASVAPTSSSSWRWHTAYGAFLGPYLGARIPPELQALNRLDDIKEVTVVGVQNE